MNHNSNFNNGYGKKILTSILIFLINFLVFLIIIRIILFRNDQFVPLLDSMCGASFYFIIHLGVAIAKNRYGDNMKGFDDDSKWINK